MPSTGVPGPRARRRSPRRARARGSARIAVGKAPTPGRTRPSAARDRLGVGADHGLGADVLERLLDRAQVSHPVVEDRDPRLRSRVSVPFVRRHAGLVGVDRDRLAQRAGERLEAGLDHVVGVGAVAGAEVQGQLRVGGDGAEELLGQLGVEAGDRDRRQLGARTGRAGGPRCRSRTSRAPRPSARPCSRSGGSRLRSPSASSSAWPSAMPTSSTVWWAPVSRSPLASHREPEPAVAAEQLEHVVEEPDARSTALTSPPSRSSVERDLGLAGLARRSSRCGSWLIVLSRCACAADSPWTGKPSAPRDRRRRAAPAPRRPPDGMVTTRGRGA